MTTPNVEEYPHGRVSIGNGEWGHCTGFKLKYTNAGELVTTLGGTGFTTGPRTGEASFDTTIGVDGQDLDTFKKIKDGVVLQARFKFPGRALTITGIMTASDYDFPHDKPITESITMVGTVDAS